jgi:hypothetical protein
MGRGKAAAFEQGSAAARNTLQSEKKMLSLMKIGLDKDVP